MEKQREAAKKQNQVIIGIKSCIKNVALSLTNCSRGEDEKDGKDLHNESNEPAEFSEGVETSGQAAPQTELLKNSDARSEATRANLQAEEDQCFTIKIVKCTGGGGETKPVPILSPFASSPVPMETCSSGVGRNIGEEETADMDDEDKDSSYFPGDKSEDESDREMEDEDENKTRNGFQCSNCSKSFSLKKYLKNHIRRVHTTNKGSVIKYHLCAKVFKGSGGLTRYIWSTHEGIRYQCAHCPGTFSLLENVRRHEQTVHLEGAAPKQMCKICGIHLLNKHSLLIHMGQLHKDIARMSFKEPVQRGRIMGKEKMPRTIIFKCQLCSTQFPARADLHSHQRRVHGIDTKTGEEAGK